MIPQTSSPSSTLTPLTTLSNTDHPPRRSQWHTKLGWDDVPNVNESRRHSLADIPTRRGSVAGAEAARPNFGAGSLWGNGSAYDWEPTTHVEEGRNYRDGTYEPPSCLVLTRGLPLFPRANAALWVFATEQTSMSWVCYSHHGSASDLGTTNTFCTCLTRSLQSCRRVWATRGTVDGTRSTCDDLACFPSNADARNTLLSLRGHSGDAIAASRLAIQSWRRPGVM